MDQVGCHFLKVSFGNQREVVELLTEALQLLVRVFQRLHQEVKEGLSIEGIWSKTLFFCFLILLIKYN